MVIDNTLASPWLCRPFEWGADIVVHSTTKFIGGHGNTMGGVVVESGKFDWRQNDKFPGLSQPDPAYHGLTFAETFGDFGFTMKVRMVALRDYGPTLYPTAAWNLLQGWKPCRCAWSAIARTPLARRSGLETHPKVRWVSYSGLESSPYYALAKKYMPRGAGAVFHLRPRGRLRSRPQVRGRSAPVLASRQYRRHAQPYPAPASTTHRQLTAEQQEAAGAGPDVVRLSIGIETLDDIIADLDRALSTL